MRLFVYRPGAIGDTVLTLPALAALRRRFPGCAITYAGNAAMAPLLPVEEALSADDVRLLPLFAVPPQPWPGADWHVIFARQPCGLPGIQRDPLEAVASGIHVADWLVDGVDPGFAERVPRLEVPSGGEPAAAQGAPVVIHPGAGSPAKRWPAEKFAQLVRRLALPFAAIQGPADEPFPGGELWHNRPLPELASRLKRSRLFVGNDSGITHLAAAAGTPTVAIYAASDPALWGVRGAHTRRLIGDVSVDNVLACCRQLLG
jgi:heptosyltransferase-3